MEKKILILSDFVGFGDVALTAARSLLTSMGHQVFALPTVLLSNTWNYGAAEALSTTDFILRSLATWENLGLYFDAVLIGYVADEAQTENILDLCSSWKEQGIPVILDPLFADNGKRYNSISERHVELLRKLMTKADYILPNLTEAFFLAGLPYPNHSCSRKDLTELLNHLIRKISGKVIVTGAENTCAVHTGKDIVFYPYEAVPGSFSGTGDAFTAIFVGELLKGASLSESVITAQKKTKEFILRSVAENWSGTGLPVERWL